MRRILRNRIESGVDQRDFVESNHDNAAVTKPFRERQRSVGSVTTHDPWQWWMRGNWFLFLDPNLAARWVSFFGRSFLLFFFPL